MTIHEAGSLSPEIQRGEFGPEGEGAATVWWEINSGALAYAAIGSTPEEAIRRVADDIGIPPGSMHVGRVFASPCEPELQARLAEVAGNRGATRMIPFSDETWPEDLNDLTDSQQAAFERLRQR